MGCQIEFQQVARSTHNDTRVLTVVVRQYFNPVPAAFFDIGFGEDGVGVVAFARAGVLAKACADALQGVECVFVIPGVMLAIAFRA